MCGDLLNPPSEQWGVTHLELFWIEQLLFDLLQPGLPHRLLRHRTHRILRANKEKSSTPLRCKSVGVNSNVLRDVRANVLLEEDSYPAPVPEPFNLLHLKLVRFQNRISVIWKQTSQKQDHLHEHAHVRPLNLAPQSAARWIPETRSHAAPPFIHLHNETSKTRARIQSYSITHVCICSSVELSLHSSK